MSDPAPGSARPSPLKRWLREPLLHFLLSGFVLFAAYGALNPQTATASNPTGSD